MTEAWNSSGLDQNGPCNLELGLLSRMLHSRQKHLCIPMHIEDVWSAILDKVHWAPYIYVTFAFSLS